MKKTNLTGVGNVFSFTLTQTLKSKSFITSLIIMLTFSLISMPILYIITGGLKKKNAPSPINKVYVSNESSLSELDFTGLLTDNAFAHITFEKMNESYDTVADRIQTQEKTSVILTISDKEGVFDLSFAKAGDGPVSKGDLQQLGSVITEKFNVIRINSLGIAPEQLQMIFSPISTSVSHADADGQLIIEEDTTISQVEYYFVYGILVIILMISTVSGSLIATAIVTEKSTRVIEYLLITVKPLALMVGKVLATLIATLIQTGSMVLVIFLSNVVTKNFLSSTGESILAKYLPANIFDNLNIINIIACFILMLLGLLFYAILASFAGATVSKLEEIQEGMTLFSLVGIVGAYIGIGAAASLMSSGESAFVTFALLFPLSSPFLLPGVLLIGKTNLMIVALGVVLEIIAILLLFKLVASVFEILILHNGNTIKPKELIKFFKTAKEGK